MPIYSGDRDTRGEAEGEEAVAQNPQNGLATKRSRAIDLSCRACGAGAGCWAWIPGRGTFGVHPHPPMQNANQLQTAN